MYTTHGLSPTQIRGLGYVFNEQEFAKKMEEHQKLSRAGAEQKFKGGLADHAEKTIMGHTATHLLHKALRDMFGEQLHQTGSNITSERVRFDFNFDRKLEDNEITQIEATVNEKIKENLPVHFEILPLAKAKQLGAIGLFDEKYADNVKVYFVGDYSKEFCGGPHVNFTGEIKKFKIIKQENIGHGQRRIYAVVG
jgi:alanyl-tRNA synthetase